jgi:DNA (cytosine-5)-methyltransferase 1
VGLKQAGFAVLGAIEIDRLAAHTYALNHPDVHLWHDDIRNVSGASIRRHLGLRVGDLDLLVGCPPCQGFSRLRNLNGGARVREPRNELLFDFLRIARALHPRALMLENVPGLARHYKFPIFLRRLRQLGYESTWSVLDAVDYGVPQRRARLLVLSGRTREIPFPRPARRAYSVRGTIGHLPPVTRSADPAHAISQKRSDRISSLIRHVPRNGGSRSDLPSRFRLACHSRCDGFYDVYGRMSWDAASPTITSGFVNPSKGRFLHPYANRTITIREAALLQTFPANYRFPMEHGKYPVATLVGNAAPPELIKRQAMSVRRYLSA